MIFCFELYYFVKLFENVLFDYLYYVKIMKCYKEENEYDEVGKK